MTRKYFNHNEHKYTIVQEEDADFFRIGKDLWNDGCYLFYSVQKAIDIDEAIKLFLRREYGINN